MGVPRIEDDTIITWLDLETTGLPESDPDILEIGVILTRGPELEELAEMNLLTHRPELGPAATRNRSSEIPKKMHQESGLWQEHSDPSGNTLPYNDAESAIIELIDRYNARGSYMGGASITFDRTLLSWHMPRLLGALSYRSLDISSVALFLSSKMSLPYLGERVPHRALGDLRANIMQYRAYRDMITIKSPEEWSDSTREQIKLGSSNLTQH